MNNFTRGDSLDFKFKIKKGETYITFDECAEVELTINSNIAFGIKKTKENMTFDVETNFFVVRLEQEDTFKLLTGNNKVQVRVIMDNNATATLIGSILVGEVLSSQVIGGDEE